MLGVSLCSLWLGFFTEKEREKTMEVKLPELGEGVNEASVSYWLYQEGDEVKEGEDLVEMTTDKAAFNVPSPTSGILKEISAEEGETIKVGQKLASIMTNDK